MEQKSAVHGGRSHQRWIYVLAGVIIMMCLGTVYSWSIFRIPIERFFGIRSAQSGFPYMVSLAFYALSMFITGRYLDKFNPRYIILLGGILVGAGWILSGYTRSIMSLTLTYGMVIGIGVGIVYGVPMTVAAKWFPENKGLAVGIVLAGFGLSPFITAPFARHLIEAYGIMQSFKILGAVFGIAISLLALLFKYPALVQAVKHDKGSSGNDVATAGMVRTKSFIGLYLSFVIGTTIGLKLVGMTSNVGIELIRLTPSRVALFMSMFAVFNGIGRPIYGWVSDRLSYKLAMRASFIMILIAAVMMLTAGEGSVAIYSAAFSIFWYNLGGWLAIAPTTTLTLYGTRYYSQNYGVIFTAYGIGAIIGVYISGFLKDLHQTYHSTFYFVIILCIAGLLSSGLLENKRLKD